jgi:hypothetical protein
MCEPREYGIFVMWAMVIQWVLIMDLVVFSTALLAYVLVIGHVLIEVGRFLVALTFLISTFSCATACLLVDDAEITEFDSIFHAFPSFVSMTLKVSHLDLVHLEEVPELLVALYCYRAIVGILLLNMLIAQMNCSYSLIFDDMLGYARLKRSRIIVETMEGCPITLWERFLKSCGFGDCLEFDKGDVGIPGGMTTQEPANWHTVVEDNVKRFGGDAMPMAPWPSDKTDEDDNRLSRIEKLLQRVSQRFERIAGQAKTVSRKNAASSSGKQDSSEHSSEKDD